MRSIKFATQVGDVTTFDADVVALKFAQRLFGADQAVAQALGKREEDIASALLSLGAYKLFPAVDKIGAQQALLAAPNCQTRLMCSFSAGT
jgi:hypothetical protein